MAIMTIQTTAPRGDDERRSYDPQALSGPGGGGGIRHAAAGGGGSGTLRNGWAGPAVPGARGVVRGGGGGGPQ